MKRLIYLSIFFPILLFASIENTLLNDINSTYSNNFYKTVFKDADTLKFGSSTRDNAHIRIKEDFEKILPEYLACENLFDKQNFKSLDLRKNSFINFITASLLYMHYLEKEERHADIKALMQKNLKNAKSLMTNSNEIFDYIIALGVYKIIYNYFEKPSRDILLVLRKYPMPEKEIFFEKLKSEQTKALDAVSEMSTTTHLNGIPFSSDLKENIMSAIRGSATKYINIYFSKMAEALVSESVVEVENFLQYIKQENEFFYGIWFKIKLYSYALMLKVESIFFDNIDYSYATDNIGKIIALAAVPNPKLNSLYFKHMLAIENYNILIEDNSF